MGFYPNSQSPFHHFRSNIRVRVNDIALGLDLGLDLGLRLGVASGVCSVMDDLRGRYVRQRLYALSFPAKRCIFESCTLLLG